MRAIARALMTDPKQLLRDESSTGLASRNVQAVFELLPWPRGRGARVVLADQSLPLGLLATALRWRI